MNRILSALALCMVLAGCALDQAYRMPVEQPRLFLAGQPKSYSLEEHAYSVRDDAGSYYMGYVEFDDQGWYHDLRQQQGLLSWLRAQRTSAPGRRFLIVTYAHGWKHNASTSDPDVDNFRKLLQSLAVQEQAAQRLNPAHQARTVVGVYLGWRGESIRVPLFKELTFWTRKNAAERVGHRSAKDLLMLLNQFRALSNGWCTSNILAGPHETQLVFIGHSFEPQSTQSGTVASIRSPVQYNQMVYRDKTVPIKNRECRTLEAGMAHRRDFQAGYHLVLNCIYHLDRELA